MYEKEILELYRYCNVHSFPIDCDEIIRKIGYRTVTYQEYAGDDKAKFIELMQTSGDAFIVRRERMLYYNAMTDRRRQRFSKAHELGHIVLVTNDEDEADTFAAEVLAPRPVIFARQIKTAQTVSKVFDISIAAANRALISKVYSPDDMGMEMIDYFGERRNCPWPYNQTVPEGDVEGWHPVERSYYRSPIGGITYLPESKPSLRDQMIQRIAERNERKQERIRILEERCKTLGEQIGILNQAKRGGKRKLEQYKAELRDAESKLDELYGRYTLHGTNDLF